MARSRGQPVSPSLPGHQLSLVCQSPPWRSEVCILGPGVLARMLWEACTHISRYHDFCLSIFSRDINPVALVSYARARWPRGPPRGGALQMGL